MKRGLRSRLTQYGDEDFALFLRRGFLKSAGFTDDALDRPIVGVLSTASDVVFAGGREGYFFALNGRTGELLWKGNVGGQVSAGPMSYAVGGRQYVAIAAGSALFVYALRM